jgi:hypothetical protein
VFLTDIAAVARTVLEQVLADCRRGLPSRLVIAGYVDRSGPEAYDLRLSERRAHRWRCRIESGQPKSITDLAERVGVTVAFVCRLLPLTCLAPDIVEAIHDGRQPKGLRACPKSSQMISVGCEWPDEELDESAMASGRSSTRPSSASV